MNTTDNEDHSPTIQWFPGHMARAVRQVKQQINLVDIVVEVRDARLPMQSGNLTLDEILGEKKKIVLLNKADLADPEITKQWINYFKKHYPLIPHFFNNCNEPKSVKKIIPIANQLMKTKWEKWKKKGIRRPVLRMMILGLPNTGKSTLINRLAKKAKAKTGNRPGITQTQQWIVVNEDIELLDTPGIMPPKVESFEQGLNLAVINAIKEGIVPQELINQHFLKDLDLENMDSRSTQKALTSKLLNVTLESIPPILEKG